MKKSGIAVKASLLGLIAAAVLLAAAACANPVAAALNASNWGLVGTWVNPSYPLSYLPQCYQFTIYANGTILSTDQAQTTSSSATYTVTSASLSGNVRTYKVYLVIGISQSYALVRITNGTAFESQSNTFSYPTFIDTFDPSYATYTLQ
jgi:hypothetical protein